MNLVYKHHRNSIEKDPYLWFSYVELLILRNQKIIKKYCNMLLIEEVYMQFCVKRLPLKTSYTKSLCKYSKPRDVPYSFYHDPKNGNIKAGIQCAMCWAKTLERIYEVIDVEQTLPSFLKKKEPPKFLK